MPTESAYQPAAGIWPTRIAARTRLQPFGTFASGERDFRGCHLFSDVVRKAICGASHEV